MGQPRKLEGHQISLQFGHRRVRAQMSLAVMERGHVKTDAIGGAGGTVDAAGALMGELALRENRAALRWEDDDAMDRRHAKMVTYNAEIQEKGYV